jgi:hypothetical protein
MEMERNHPQRTQMEADGEKGTVHEGKRAGSGRSAAVFTIPLCSP